MNRNRNLNTLCLSLFCTFNLAQVSAQSQTLPDEINYPRYEIILGDAYDRLSDSTDLYQDFPRFFT